LRSAVTNGRITMSDSLAIDDLPVIITRHLTSDDFCRMI